MKKIFLGYAVIIGLSALVGIFFIARSQPISQQPSNTQLPVKQQELPYPSLTSIFSLDHSWIATLSAENVVTLIATGDIIPARSVNYKTVKNKNFIWPYEKTADIVKSADITFVNLETPLLKKCPVTVEGMIFCGDAKNVEGLLYAGVDVASLANNHAGNHGESGIVETTALLENNGITVTGVSAPVYKRVKGTRFAFLGYNDIGSSQGIQHAIEEVVKTDIATARKNADVVVVTYHWGAEYKSQPDTRQKYLGRFTIDSGADLVIGNHPHWVQPIEVYKEKLISYAHGNYIFDQMWSEKTKQGVIGKYVFYNSKLIDVEYIPLYISDYGQAAFLSGKKKNQILAEMHQQSEVLSTIVVR